MAVRIFFLLLMLVTVGCGALPGGPTPTPDPLAGTVTLTTPPDGAVIYASALYVAGTLADVPSKTLMVRLRADDQVLAQARVDAAQGEWSVEIVHGYNGMPTPVTVEVVPFDAPEAGVLASSQVMFASLDDRPEGSFVILLSPEDGREIGGDEVLVSGTASGIPGRTFTVSLTDSNSQTLDTKMVTLSGRHEIDEYPWEVALQTQGYVGNAVIRVTAGDDPEAEPLAAISVVMTSAAG